MSTKPQQSKAKKEPKLRFPGFSGAWEEKKIGNLDIFISDGNYGEMYPKASEMVDCGVPFIRANNINNLKVIWDDIKYIDKELHDVLQSGHLKENDILVTTRGDIGMLARVGKDFEDANINAQICLLRCGRNLSPLFLLNYLSSRIGKSQFNELQTGSALKQLPKGNLVKIKINTPSFDEQQKIAEFLGATDEWIENLRAQKESLESYKKGMMQKIFSQEIRFKDENGKDFPEWEEKKLGEVLKIGNGKDYKHLGDGNIPVFGTGGYMLSVDEYIYDGESVLIGRKGTIDKPFYYSGKFWTVDTLFFTHSFKGVLPKFINLFFQKINWLKYNEASGVPSLSKTTLEKIKIIFPSLSEQRKIVEFLTSLDNLIELNQQQITQVEQWRNGLMQELFV